MFYRLLLPLLAVLSLAACAAPGNDWQEVDYGIGKGGVGAMGPSGSIGP